MASQVCEHCNKLVSRHDVVIREGHSYHEKCHKCYVCSETNLHEAEVFKGVIFCSSCSKRIFQGCSAARQNKNLLRPRRNRSRPRRHRRQDRRPSARRERPKLQRESGVIELARLAHSARSGSENSQPTCIIRPENTIAMPMPTTLHVRKEVFEDTYRDMLQDSTEIGITTDITQELLKQMNCPVVEWKSNKEGAPAKLTNKRKDDIVEERRTKRICSDLRIAELGTSTEIATMALRKQSEVPLCIRSETDMKQQNSQDLSYISDQPPEDLEEWLETTYSKMQDEDSRRRFTRGFRSILRMPYQYFKSHVLDRSSLISVIINSDKNKINVMKRFKSIFREEITEHQRRGVKKLYSTINRRQSPYKLGWLHMYPAQIENRRPHRNTVAQQRSFRCKHYRHSHSYRCLRAQVMRRAGPTKSRLALFRRQCMNLVAPSFIRDIFNSPLMLSQGCGNEAIRRKSPAVYLSTCQSDLV